MSLPPTLTVLSLGGGVQSSVMALMAGESLPPTGSGGAFGRMPAAPSSGFCMWSALIPLTVSSKLYHTASNWKHSVAGGTDWPEREE